MNVSVDTNLSRRILRRAMNTNSYKASVSGKQPREIRRALQVSGMRTICDSAERVTAQDPGAGDFMH